MQNKRSIFLLGKDPRFVNVNAKLDLDDHKSSSMQSFSSVQDFRLLGAVKVYNSYNGIVS